MRLGIFAQGVLHAEKSLEDIDPEKALETFRVNALGHLLLARSLIRYVPDRNSKLTEVERNICPSFGVMAMLSARVGSIADNTNLGGWWSYRASKAAVNQIAHTTHLYLEKSKKANAIAISYHPATLRTDLSKPFWPTITEEKIMSPEKGAQKMAEVIAGLKREDGGLFFDWKGEQIPW